jgi:hypothetical protein
MFSEIMRYILDLGRGADKVRAVHVGLDFIDPALHQIQLNVVVCAQFFWFTACRSSPVSALKPYSRKSSASSRSKRHV